MVRLEKQVSCILKENLNVIKRRLNYSLSYDLIIREFNMMYDNNPYNGFLVYFDGMVNKDYINNSILFNMNLTFNSTNNYIAKTIQDFVANFTLSNCSLEKKDSFDEIISDICFGNVAVFI